MLSEAASTRAPGGGSIFHILEAQAPLPRRPARVAASAPTSATSPPSAARPPGARPRRPAPAAPRGTRRRKSRGPRPRRQANDSGTPPKVPPYDYGRTKGERPPKSSLYSCTKGEWQWPQNQNFHTTLPPESRRMRSARGWTAPLPALSWARPPEWGRRSSAPWLYGCFLRTKLAAGAATVSFACNVPFRWAKAPVHNKSSILYSTTKPTLPKMLSFLLLPPCSSVGLPVCALP